MFRKILHKISRFMVLSLVIALCFFSDALAQNDIQKQKLSDGVMRYYRSQKEQKPWFFRQVENLFNVLLPNENELPFGKSVAFLVGVSDYEYLSPDLPFVKNDLEALREYLLERGGFDEVYVAADDIVTTRLVEDYILNQFSTKLGAKDRLLFYYSGHGADFRGNTGYLQFSKVRSGQFDTDQWLAIDRCFEWSKVLPASHVLFIFDCCVSGLAFTKEGSSDSRTDILRTLGGERSRMVITAGTGKESSLGLPDKRSVFTDAFLNALKNPRTEDCFVTITQIFAQVESEVLLAAKRKGHTQTPMIQDIERSEKSKGRFLFIDTSSPKNACLSKDAKDRLKAIDKGSDVIRAEVSPPKPEPEPVVEIRQEPKTETKPVVEIPKEKTVQPQVQKPKYQLRKEPVTVSDEEASKVFKLARDKMIMADLTFYFWRTIEYIENDFKDNEDGTITDHATGLMWQRSDSDKIMNYWDAKAYIDELNHKKFAGYSDWRLPTVDELKSLITKNKQSNNLYIYPIFNGGYLSFWTADQHVSGNAWSFNFNTRKFGDANLLALFYVRAVRSLQ